MEINGLIDGIILVKASKKIVCAFFWVLLLPVRGFIAAVALILSFIIQPFLFLAELSEWACDDYDFDWNPLPFYKDLFWEMFIKGRICFFFSEYLV